MTQRILLHTGPGHVRERIIVCRACGINSAPFDGALCRSCVKRAESFWLKRLAVKARGLIWLALGAVIVASIWALVKR